MTRLKKELMDRGIIYDTLDMYDAEQRLVEITSEFIITVYYCNVLDPIIKLFDRKSLVEIGGQDLHPSRMWRNSWGSYAISARETNFVSG